MLRFLLLLLDARCRAKLKRVERIPSKCLAGVWKATVSDPVGDTLHCARKLAPVGMTVSVVVVPVVLHYLISFETFLRLKTSEFVL